MSGFDNTHWTNEEKIAFETWLKISIEMIEKYCAPEESLEDTKTTENNLKIICNPPKDIIL